MHTATIHFPSSSLRSSNIYSKWSEIAQNHKLKSYNITRNCTKPLEIARNHLELREIARKVCENKSKSLKTNRKLCETAHIQTKLYETPQNCVNVYETSLIRQISANKQFYSFFF